jgi:hypothetical protein
MNILRTSPGILVRWACCVMAATWLGMCSGSAETEEKFDVLKIGSSTYRNVTVTTKTRKYVFIVHSTGMTNVKVAELPSEIREQLGYTNEAPKAAATTPAAWVKKELAKLPPAQVAQVEQRWTHFWPAVLTQAKSFSRSTRIAAAGVAVAAYLLFCYCGMLVCQKTGHKPGILLWLPLVQLVPLLKAARMSGWWFVACLVPVLNVVVQMIWAVKIVQARGKPLALAAFLVLPVTNVFAFLYLAFSNGSAGTKEPRVVEVMTLEAA